MQTPLRYLTALACITFAHTASVAIAQTSQHPSHAARAEHAVAGELKNIDHGAKILVIRTADGTEETFKFVAGATVRGVTDVAHVTDVGAKAALEGAAVVVSYTGEGVAKTAVGIDHLGKRTLQLAKGTIVRVDEGGKYVVIKTASGVEETYDLTKDCVVDTGRGIERGVRATGAALKHGAKATIHYSEEGGKKVAHLFEQL
jgi:arginine repressor